MGFIMDFDDDRVDAMDEYKRRAERPRQYERGAMKTELLEALRALRTDMADLLFEASEGEGDAAQIAYARGCADTKRDALQLIEAKIKEIEATV